MAVISQLRATSTPALGVIPISDGSGAPDESLNEWVSDGSGGGVVDAEDVFYSNGSSGLAANNVQDAIDELALSSGSGAAGDFTSNLASPEVSITGAITLTTSDFGKLFVCSGGADYIVDLPNPTGFDDSIISFRVVSSLPTIFVTLRWAGGINGASTRIMQFQEGATLIAKSGVYAKLFGETLPMICQISRTSNQAIGSVTATKVDCDQTDIDSNGRMADIGNGRMFIRRSGLYALQADITTTAGTAFGSQNQIRVHKNGAFDFNRASIDIGLTLIRYPAFVAGDYIELFTFAAGAGFTLYGDGSKATAMLICEVPQW